MYMFSSVSWSGSIIHNYLRPQAYIIPCAYNTGEGNLLNHTTRHAQVQLDGFWKTCVFPLTYFKFYRGFAFPGSWSRSANVRSPINNRGCHIPFKLLGFHVGFLKKVVFSTTSRQRHRARFARSRREVHFPREVVWGKWSLKRRLTAMLFDWSSWTVFASFVSIGGVWCYISVLLFLLGVTCSHRAVLIFQMRPGR